MLSKKIHFRAIIFYLSRPQDLPQTPASRDKSRPQTAPATMVTTYYICINYFYLCVAMATTNFVISIAPIRHSMMKQSENN